MKNYLAEAWDEFINLPICDAPSEFSGFLSALPAKRDGDCVLVDTRKLVIARRIMKLAGGLSTETREKVIPRYGNFLELDKSRGRALFRVQGGAYSEMNQRTFRKWAWFRGVWGGCGSLYLPRVGYYMSLRPPRGRDCEKRLSAILRSSGVNAGARSKRGRTEYMIRNLEDIVTVLAGMGFVRTSLMFEETAVLRSARGTANKLTNCDRANIGKALDAARLQMRLVDALDEKGLWDAISPQLAEVARTRREHPSASLGELGQILSKPVSKSTVKYRWKKLEAFLAGINTMKTKRG
ncbi:MAG: DNA-binding protein WhiA [Synergistaceae bacterium]|jgi:DNA-binding transcriptional regulator WhiA|nr:DNA-binding protein WhiA [Synergistaceae bacterium]